MTLIDRGHLNEQRCQRVTATPSAELVGWTSKFSSLNCHHTDHSRQHHCELHWSWAVATVDVRELEPAAVTQWFASIGGAAQHPRFRPVIDVFCLWRAITAKIHRVEPFYSLLKAHHSTCRPFVGGDKVFIALRCRRPHSPTVSPECGNIFYFIILYILLNKTEPMKNRTPTRVNRQWARLKYIIQSENTEKSNNKMRTTVCGSAFRWWLCGGWLSIFIRPHRPFAVPSSVYLWSRVIMNDQQQSVSITVKTTLNECEHHTNGDDDDGGIRK